MLIPPVAEHSRKASCNFLLSLEIVPATRCISRLCVPVGRSVTSGHIDGATGAYRPAGRAYHDLLGKWPAVISRPFDPMTEEDGRILGVFETRDQAKAALWGARRDVSRWT